MNPRRNNPKRILTIDSKQRSNKKKEDPNTTPDPLQLLGTKKHRPCHNPYHDHPPESRCRHRGDYKDDDDNTNNPTITTPSSRQ